MLNNPQLRFRTFTAVTSDNDHQEQAVSSDLLICRFLDK